jgi:hypothetical protein
LFRPLHSTITINEVGGFSNLKAQSYIVSAPKLVIFIFIGEFGVVYMGTWKTEEKKVTVAIKTYIKVSRYLSVW